MSDFQSSPSPGVEMFGTFPYNRSLSTTANEFAASPAPSQEQQTSLIEALAAVEEHANDEWKDAALRIVRHLCETRRTFTTDDIAEELGKTMHRTHEPRAMGAIMRRAAKEGWCEKTAIFQKSTRKNCHGMDIPRWRSLIHPDNVREDRVNA